MVKLLSNDYARLVICQDEKIKYESSITLLDLKETLACYGLSEEEVDDFIRKNTDDVFCMSDEFIWVAIGSAVEKYKQGKTKEENKNVI